MRRACIESFPRWAVFCVPLFSHVAALPRKAYKRFTATCSSFSCAEHMLCVVT